MNPPSLSELLAAVKLEVGKGLQGAGSKACLTVHFTAEAMPDDRLRLQPILGGDNRNQPSVGDHTLVVDFNMAPSNSESGVREMSRARVNAPFEVSVSGEGDRQTLQRRLELVLGGPPGFSTGAKAEVLADLLEEVGRASLIEIIRRDWISQFDTGPDASGSVLKVPRENAKRRDRVIRSVVRVEKAPWPNGD